MVLALEIEMGHCAIFFNERDDEALSQPTYFMKIFALILSLKISSELVGCLVGDFRGTLSRPFFSENYIEAQAASQVPSWVH